MINQDNQQTIETVSETRKLIDGLDLGLDKAVVGYGRGSQSNKAANEDNYWPHRPEERDYYTTGYYPIDYLIAGRLYIVADGVSRGLSGEKASQLAVNTIAAAYYTSVLRLERYPSESDLEQALLEAIMCADQRLLNESLKERREKGLVDTTSYLQTTALCGLLRGSELIIASVGDSRLYRLRKNNLDRAMLLSVDENGENAYFVGSNLQKSQISVFRRGLLPKDILILCSDGLYKYLDTNNEPEKAGEIIAQVYHGYYHNPSPYREGVQRISYELLDAADDPKRSGGGDNITVMVVETPPSQSFFEWSNTDQDNIKNLTKIAWFDPDYLLGIENEAQTAVREYLGKLCAKQANRLASGVETSKSEMWQHRANQLGEIGSLGIDEFEQARKLYAKLGLDFASNKDIVKEIRGLYNKASSNSPLRTLALDATIDLANLALMSADGEAMWEAWRLLYPLFVEIELQLEDSKRELAEETLRQLEEQLAHACLSLVFPGKIISDKYTTSFGEFIRDRYSDVRRPTYTMLVDTFRSRIQKHPQSEADTRSVSPQEPVVEPPELPLHEKQSRTAHAESKSSDTQPIISQEPGTGILISPPREKQLAIIHPAPKLPADVQPISTQKPGAIVSEPSLRKKKYWNISLILLVLVAVIVACAIGSKLLSRFNRSTDSPTMDSPTLDVTRIPPIDSGNTPAGPVPSPGGAGTALYLSIEEMIPQVTAIENGRKQVKLVAHFDLTLPESFQDTNAVIELQTILPEGLTPIVGAGYPPPEISDNLDAPVIQSIPIGNVDLQNIVFESLYIVEWPDVARPAYAVTMKGKLVGSDGGVLAQTAQSAPPFEFEIEHQPDLDVAQIITPDSVSTNDPITYQLTIHNVGETNVDRLEINWDASQIGAYFVISDTNEWQERFANITLEPGQTVTVSIPAQMDARTLEPLAPLIAVNGILTDGSAVPSNGVPAAMTVYARGKTVFCVDCVLEHRLQPSLDSPLGSDYVVLPNQTEVRVLDAALHPDLDSVWYQIKIVVDNQLEEGWLWSERVQLDDPDIKEYLQSRAGG